MSGQRYHFAAVEGGREAMVNALLDLAIRLETGAIDPGFSHLEVEKVEVSMQEFGSMQSHIVQAGVEARLTIDLSKFTVEELQLFVKEHF